LFKEHGSALFTKYYAGDQIKSTRWSTWNTCGKRRGTYRFLVGKHEEEITLGRFGLRWEDNIKIYFQ